MDLSTIPYNVHTDILYCIGMYIIGYDLPGYREKPYVFLEKHCAFFQRIGREW